MRLPAEIVAAGKQQIQSLWDDTATITRKHKVGNVMQDLVQYQGIKCHLSQSTQAAVKQSDTIAVTESAFTLFVDTAVKLKAGDTATVSHKNQTFVGVIGEPFYRSFSNGAKVKVESIT